MVVSARSGRDHPFKVIQMMQKRLPVGRIVRRRGLLVGKGQVNGASPMDTDFQTDIDSIKVIDAVPRILDVASRMTGMGFVAIARVTEDRWITCESRDDLGFGLKPGDELDVATTICHEIRQSREQVVIDSVDEDVVFKVHATPKQYGFKSYISVPIILHDGSFFGTLCAIDPKPRQLKNSTAVETFTLFAEMIAMQLETQDRAETAERELRDEKQTAEMREQFIAVLGHDLRNPVAAIASGARMLLKTALDDHAGKVVRLIQGSTIRMNMMIDNLMDFARGRLGEGIIIEVQKDAALEPALQQVVDELRSTTGRVIETNFDFREPVACDLQRMGQLLSNLLGNAITHGAPDVPVKVSAIKQSGMFTLFVTNGGTPIPAGDMERLFQPFSRGGDRPSQQGLGLGLFIASEIAKAHGGELTVRSSADETRFTLTMPAN